MFRGANAISLDAKGRLAMPSRYRDELVSRSSGQLIVTIDAVDPCLCVYPLDEWEIIETKLRALPSLREENRRLQRLLIGNAVDLELDGITDQQALQAAVFFSQRRQCAQFGFDDFPLIQRVNAQTWINSVDRDD